MQIRNDSPQDQGPDLTPIFRMHADLCRALANEHRQAILHTICGEERCVSDIAAEIGISVHNVSQHLRILKERRLVASRKEGQTVYYRVTNMKFMEACSLIRQALVEQHQAQTESLQAVEFLEAAQQVVADAQGPSATPVTPAQASA